MSASTLPQIVATIGPASCGPEILKEMISAGMGAARLNFSWGTHAEHANYIKRIRAAANMLEKRVVVIQDLSGPRLQEGGGHHFDESAIQALTEKDIEDVRFGVSERVDYIAMSYVGSAVDVVRLRETINSLGARVPIIAKIERQAAVNSLDEIVAAADGIMVARGDLGSALPLETIPFIQKLIIRKANGAGKPVITATQMLLSMVEHSEPTRAEVNDVANAILDGSDAVMLSEETARGAHPVEAVRIMRKVIDEARNYIYREINPI